MSKTLREKLEEPFDPTEVKWRPQRANGNRAMALCYVDARVVADRLDDVFGIGGWSDSYTLVGSNSSVQCVLTAKVDGEWISKSDVGGESDQPDETDRMKSAYSDAFKRAAVKFGIGRYLYRSGQVWEDYDTNGKKFVLTNEQLTKKHLDKKFPRKPDEPEALPSVKTPIEAGPGPEWVVKRMKCYDVLVKYNRTDLIPEGKKMADLTEDEYEKVAVEARKLAKSKPNV